MTTASTQAAHVDGILCRPVVTMVRRRMIRSMTAFAACERATRHGTLSCEMRAVNHRFLEIGMRLPEELRAWEPALRERVAARVARGKLDLVIRLRGESGAGQLMLNDRLVEQLGQLAQRLDAQFPQLQVQFTDLLAFPGVLQTGELDVKALSAEALSLLDDTLNQFVATREREGSQLAAVINARVDAIERIVGQVRALIPEIRAAQRAKLEHRLTELTQPADSGRVEQELVLWLQKLDVDEELDRLTSHVTEIRRILVQFEPAGRRLDFLLQEFNRESNTLGSKSVDIRSTNAAVELKVLIDQLREQVQNIE